VPSAAIVQGFVVAGWHLAVAVLCARARAVVFDTGCATSLCNEQAALNERDSLILGAPCVFVGQVTHRMSVLHMICELAGCSCWGKA
jgi:hypothetical protein